MNDRTPRNSQTREKSVRPTPWKPPSQLDAPPPPKPRYSMYGEEVDEQPSLWKEE